MRIGVIADTHIPKAAKALPKKVYDVFHGVNLIIHAGDIVEDTVLVQLKAISPVVAVCGNRDSDTLKHKLPNQTIIEVTGFRIGIIHGDGDKGTTMQRLPDFFRGVPLDCIIFGHSHIPYQEIIHGTLYFNPGSPTVKKRQKYPSVGILTLTETIKAELYYLI